MHAQTQKTASRAQSDQARRQAAEAADALDQMFGYYDYEPIARSVVEYRIAA